MTDNRFDELTKTLGKTASRRTVFKGVLAAALGGLLARAGADDAEAFRGRRGCGRVGQDCGGDNPGCCVGLTCGTADICCVAGGDSCLENSDCCSNACDPYSHTCLVGVGENCVSGEECETGFCDPYTHTCTEFCFGETADCFDDFQCCGDLVCAPNLTLGVAAETYCVQCGGDGDPCFDDRQCCAGVCDSYTGACVGDCVPQEGECEFNEDCCKGGCFEGRCIVSD